MPDGLSPSSISRMATPGSKSYVALLASAALEADLIWKPSASSNDVSSALTSGSSSTTSTQTLGLSQGQNQYRILFRFPLLVRNN
jgi:hypothetical protein